MAKFDVVFEGGGSKGVAFVGALEVLEERGHTTARLLGTSAGAITAALCAAGYTSAQLRAAVEERVDGKPRFLSFMDAPEAAAFSEEAREQSLTMEMLRNVDLPLIPGSMESRLYDSLLDGLLKDRRYARVFSFVERGGFYAGSAFLRWISEKLSVKGIDASDTLAEFHTKTGADLSLVVSDVDDCEMIVLNHRTAPFVPVAWAVRMSMSIPLVWQEVVWPAEWGLYLGRSKTGHAIVDGGLLSNFPIKLIATSDALVREIMGEADPEDALNLGLLIDEATAVPGAAPTCAPPALSFTSFRAVQRVSRIVDTMLSASDNEMIRRFSSEICRLPAKGYGTLEFGMEGERLQSLLTAARTAMNEHLRSRGI